METVASAADKALKLTITAPLKSHGDGVNFPELSRVISPGCLYFNDADCRHAIHEILQDLEIFSLHVQSLISLSTAISG